MMMEISGTLADITLSNPFTVAGCMPTKFRHFRKFFVPNSVRHSINSFSFSVPKNETKLEKSRAWSLMVKTSSDLGHELSPTGPLQLQSPVGLVLAQIQRNQPHLVPAAIDQLLELLQSERDSVEGLPRSTNTCNDSMRSIYDKKVRPALEEIIYCWIVNKFSDKEISMIPKVTLISELVKKADFWQNQELKLKSIHTPEALEGIERHISFCIGEWENAIVDVGKYYINPQDLSKKLLDRKDAHIAETCKVKLGEFYLSAIVYGYNIQPHGISKTVPELFSEGNEFESHVGDDLMNKTNSRYRSMRSEQVKSLVKRQIEALIDGVYVQTCFWRDILLVGISDYNLVVNNTLVEFKKNDVRVLLLEAIAFGSFLWEAENYIESKFHFLEEDEDKDGSKKDEDGSKKDDDGWLDLSL